MKVITLQFRVKFQKGERKLFFGDAVNCYYSAQTVVGELIWVFIVGEIIRRVEVLGETSSGVGPCLSQIAREALPYGTSESSSELWNGHEGSNKI